MAANLDNVLEITHDILKNNPLARNDDGVLISSVMEQMNPQITGLKFTYVLQNRKALDLPTFETITRARRKLQSAHPSLRADKSVSDYRAGLKEEYKDFSRKKV